MTIPSTASPPAVDWSSVAVLTLLGCYTHIDAITPRGVPAWPLVYGGLILSIACIGMLSRSVGKPSAPGLVVIGLLIIAAVGIPAALQQRLFYVNYFAGDIAKVLAPVVFWWVAERHPQLFQSEWSIRYLLWWMLTAAVCAPVYSWLFAPYADYFEVLTSDRGRYDPPHPVLIAMVWFYFLHRPSVASTFSLVLVAALAFFSQQRTNALLVPLVGVFAVTLEWHHIGGAAKRGLFWLAVGTVLCSAAIGVLLPVVSPAYQDELEDVLFYTRFDRLAGGLDDSGSNRFLEVRDVLHNLREAGPLAWLLGMGHGATYTPYESDPEANTTPEGVVHHIHIGPQQVLFRYGALGLMMVGGFFLLTLWRWIQARRPLTGFSAAQRVWLVALVGLGATFSVFGLLQDPFLSAALAALIQFPLLTPRLRSGPGAQLRG